MKCFSIYKNPSQTLGPPIYVRTQVKHWVLQLSQSLNRSYKSFSNWLHLSEISDHSALLSTMYRQPSIDLHRGFTELGFKSHPIGASATQAPTAVLQLFGTNRPILPMKRGGSVNPSANAVVLAGFVTTGIPFKAGMTICAVATEILGTYYGPEEKPTPYQLSGTKSTVSGTPLWLSCCYKQ